MGILKEAFAFVVFVRFLSSNSTRRVTVIITGIYNKYTNIN